MKAITNDCTLDNASSRLYNEIKDQTIRPKGMRVYVTDDTPNYDELMTISASVSTLIDQFAEKAGLTFEEALLELVNLTTGIHEVETTK